MKGEEGESFLSFSQIDRWNEGDIQAGNQNQSLARFV